MALENEAICFARDENNDLIIPLRKATGIEAVMIMVRTKLNLWRGEYYLNRNQGTEWIETADGTITESDAILGPAFDAARVQRILRARILEVPDTVDVTSFETSVESSTGTLRVAGTVQTRFGDADFALEIGA